VRATLATLGDRDLAAPSVIVVGAVAAEDHRWFEDRPLFGRTIVVTRARAQASDLVHRLGELGARVIEAPTIEIAEPSDGGTALRSAVADVRAFDWIVFTSPNGVHRTFAHIPDARALGSVQVAAIGPGTAEALAAYRVVADLVPRSFVAVFPAPPPDGGRVLLARAAVARDVLPDGLRDAGWTVEVVAAYETRPVAPLEGLGEQIAEADAVTFTSSSTVTNFHDAFGIDRVPATVVTIGPITSATARRAGLEVSVEADPHSIDGLVDALVRALG
jgi:uroporphyrinogen III methyltransferase/synthase